MDNLDNEKMPKNADKFVCESCNFRCCKRSNYDIHLLTAKHKRITNDNEKNAEDNKKNAASEKAFACKCGKKYKYISGLSKHRKICEQGEICDVVSSEKNSEKINEHSEDSYIKEQPNKDELLTFLLKENQEFKKMIFDLASKPSTTINGNNTNNNSFNLNIFLNEKCKDALNIQDFVDTIKLQLSDLEETGRLGYVEGLTNIVVRGLKELDVYKRPIHCSDLKREVLYVKDKNEWTKENNDKERITKAIKQISVRNAKQINEWTKQNAGYNISSNKKSDKYLKLISEANSGEPEEINKIIKHVAKQITIDKHDDFKV